jgi:hypothetical protein
VASIFVLSLSLTLGKPKLLPFWEQLYGEERSMGGEDMKLPDNSHLRVFPTRLIDYNGHLRLELEPFQ